MMLDFILEDTTESFETEKQNFLQEEALAESDVFVYIDGSKCTTRKTFFEVFSSALKFPDHFSNNWDSFNDCLQDVFLPNNKSFLIYIDHMNLLLSKEPKQLFHFYENLFSLVELEKEEVIAILLRFDE